MRTFKKPVDLINLFILYSSNHNFISEIIIFKDVYNALINLDPTKATEYDKIVHKMLKTCAEFIYSPLHYLFTMGIQHCISTAGETHHCLAK